MRYEDPGRARRHHVARPPRRSRSSSAGPGPLAGAGVPPGRVQAGPALSGATVQLRGAVVAGLDRGALHGIARAGVATGGGPYPHLERIQRSFGRHDVRTIRAHIGGAAADAARRIGALAYATGPHVAFCACPDLRMAAHEAAHVVQQRLGVSLSDGVGHPGDTFERQADAVADAVVAGRSAETLLDTAGGGTATGIGSSVQMWGGAEHYLFGNRGAAIAVREWRATAGSPPAGATTGEHGEARPGDVQVETLTVEDRSFGSRTRTGGDLAPSLADEALNTGEVPSLGRDARDVGQAVERAGGTANAIGERAASQGSRARQLGRRVGPVAPLAAPVGDAAGSAGDALESAGQRARSASEDVRRGADTLAEYLDLAQLGWYATTNHNHFYPLAFREYRHHHAEAVRIVAAAFGRPDADVRRAMQRALAVEAFAAHFLHDSFASGHMVPHALDLYLPDRVVLQELAASRQRRANQGAACRQRESAAGAREVARAGTSVNPVDAVDHATSAWEHGRAALDCAGEQALAGGESRAASAGADAVEMAAGLNRAKPWHDVFNMLPNGLPTTLGRFHGDYHAQAGDIAHVSRATADSLLDLFRAATDPAHRPRFVPTPAPDVAAILADPVAGPLWQRMTARRADAPAGSLPGYGDELGLARQRATGNYESPGGTTTPWGGVLDDLEQHTFGSQLDVRAAEGRRASPGTVAQARRMCVQSYTGLRALLFGQHNAQPVGGGVHVDDNLQDASPQVRFTVSYVAHVLRAFGDLRAQAEAYQDVVSRDPDAHPEERILADELLAAARQWESAALALDPPAPSVLPGEPTREDLQARRALRRAMDALAFGSRAAAVQRAAGQSRRQRQ